MSKLGENADRILEILSEAEKLSINELERKVPLNDTSILDLMNDCELIEIKKGKVNLTEFGYLLLTLE